MPAATLDPNLFTVVWNGIPITGFVNDGTMIAVDRNEDSFTLRNGVGGGNTRVKTTNKSGTVVVTLMESSLSNAALSAAVELDERDGSAIGSLKVTDLSGADVYRAETAWIRKPAAVEKAANAVGQREWTFETDELIMVSGGIPV